MVNFNTCLTSRVEKLLRISDSNVMANIYIYIRHIWFYIKQIMHACWQDTSSCIISDISSSNKAMRPLTRGWGGVLLGILGGAVPPGSQNPGPILDQKMSFPHWFSDLEVVTKRNITCSHKPEIMSPLLRLKPQQKDFLKSISNYTFFLIHLELKRRTHWYTNVAPS